MTTEDLNESPVEEAQGTTNAEIERISARQEDELAQANERIAALESELAQAVSSYKAMIIQTHLEVAEELIAGDSIEAIDESLEKAESLMNRIRQSLQTELAQAKVPAGAPQRTGEQSLSSLSPRQKIRQAIGGKR